jgi:hypothetical protein
MKTSNKIICLCLSTTAIIGLCLTPQAANAERLRRLERNAVGKDDAAKAGAAYDATTTPAEKDANQANRQSNQDNRQQNWDSKSPNQKAVDYNAAKVHNDNKKDTQAAEQTAVKNAESSTGDKKLRRRR